MDKPKRTRTFFVVPASGTYGDRGFVVSSHYTLEAAHGAAGPGFEVRVGFLQKFDMWFPSMEAIYPKKQK